MPLITDPDDLNQGDEVIFDTVNKTIELLTTGDSTMTDDGVVGKTVYSFTKEEWKNDANLIKFPFPFVPITDEFFELQEGWNWKDQATRNLLRRCGFLVRTAVDPLTGNGGDVTEHWAGVAILGAEADDQIYYDIGAGATDFVYTGNTAEVVQIISDPNGDGSYTGGFNRSANLTAFNRERGQLFSRSSTLVNGETSLLAPKLFSLTTGTGVDLNVLESDANIAANTPYTGMSITYYDSPQVRDIGGTNRNFGVIIDANGGTAEQVYEFVQSELRKTSDIDAGAGSLIGRVADELLKFTGGTGDGTGALSTQSATNPAGGGSGVYVDNFQTADTNRISFTDNTGAIRTFPFVAVVTLSFNANLQADPDSIYKVYLTDANGNNYGDTDAIVVNNNAGNPVEGNINGLASIQFDFDYDGNTQGGRTAGTDANITAVALGLNGAQWVIATGTITRSISNSLTLVAPTERNYENAVV